MRLREAAAMERYLLTQCCFGVVLSISFALALLATNTAGLWTLVTASAEPFTTAATVIIGSVTTLVPLVLATAVGSIR